MTTSIVATEWALVTLGSKQNWPRRVEGISHGEANAEQQVNGQCKWSAKGNRIILQLDDVHASRKLLKDIPDYLVSSGSRGDAIVFLRDELEEFLDLAASPASRLRRFIDQHFGRRKT